MKRSLAAATAAFNSLFVSGGNRLLCHPDLLVQEPVTRGDGRNSVASGRVFAAGSRVGSWVERFMCLSLVPFSLTGSKTPAGGQGRAVRSRNPPGSVLAGDGV